MTATTWSFTADEQAVAQHLGNQIGLAVKLLQQRSFREQLSRSEKLAAVGRLISGVVNDLQTPLEAISSMADSALEQHAGSTPGHELLVIASEPGGDGPRHEACLVRPARTGTSEPVALNQLLGKSDPIFASANGRLAAFNYSIWSRTSRYTCWARRANWSRYF